MTTQFRTRHERSELAASILMEHSPAVAGLLLWANHRDADDRFPRTCTDGKSIWYDEWFATLPRPQQVFVMAHEVLHVALGHPTRALRMYRQERDQYEPEIWNVAVDALVNAALTPSTREGWIQVVPNGVYLDKLTEVLNKNGWKGTLTPEAYDAEGLYRLLKQHRQKLQSAGIVGKTLKDIIMAPETGNETEEEQQLREWARRIETAAMGDRTEGILRQIKDLPTTETPWESILRTTLVHATADSLEATWARPSRRWLGLHGRVPYEQGMQRKPRPIIVLSIDSSGSIDDELFDRFISEARSIIVKTNSKLIVIVSDCEIHSVTTVDRDDEVKKIEFKGRGGTDFRPALEEAATYKPAYCVYLTDLAGTFPDTPPKFPTLWAVPEMYANGSKPPFGRLLVLK